MRCIRKNAESTGKGESEVAEKRAKTGRWIESRPRIFYPMKTGGKFMISYFANLVILMIFGLLMLFSASYATGFFRKGSSYAFILPQTLYAIAGLVVALVVSCIDYRWIRKWAWPFYYLCLLLLVVVLFMEPISNCRRWINIKHLPTLQVSEMAKFGLILLEAHLMTLHRKRVKTLKYGILIPVFGILPILVLLKFEPHYSAMILMLSILAAMMFCSGISWVWIGIAGGAGAALTLVFLFTQSGYIEKRLSTWLDPTKIQYQTQQSLYSISSGGLFGLGFGAGRQKHLWLPEATNDFIFAVLCEELGFVGAMLCVVLFMLLILQGLYIAAKAPDRFSSLMCVGITAQIAFQVIYNIAVVTDSVPNTGIGLPFFSSGGTSLVMLLAEMGVMLSISRASDIVHIQNEAEAEKTTAQQIPFPAPHEQGPNRYTYNG